MLSLRQGQTVRTSANRAGVHTRSREFSTNQTLFPVTGLALLINVGLCLLIARFTLVQLLCACIFHAPDKNWPAVDTLLLLLPTLTLAPALIPVSHLSPARMAFVSCLSQALILSLAAFNLQMGAPVRFIVALALTFCGFATETFIRSCSASIPNLCIGQARRAVNSGFCFLNILAIVCALLFSSAVCDRFGSLPAFLNAAATILLIISGSFALFLPIFEVRDIGSVKRNHFKTRVTRSFFSFAITPLASSVVIFTILLLACEQNCALSDSLALFSQQILLGCSLGATFSVLSLSRKLKLFQTIMPAAILLGAAFIAVVDPAGNHFENTNVALVLLGGVFVFSNVQFLTRAQIFYKGDSLPQLLGVCAASTALAVCLSALLIQPLLDTISATMLMRFFGLEVITTIFVLLVLKYSGFPLRELKAKFETDT